MAEASFAYVAMDRAGRRVRGAVSAVDTAAAFEQLRRDGLTPIDLRPSQRRRAAAPDAAAARLPARETADFLTSLADLLQAGADIRTSLGILGARFERPAVRAVSEQLAGDIGGGEALDRAFGRALARSGAFIAPMIAAGEAAGDLPGALRRAADVIYSRLKLRDQLVTTLSYPGFIFTMAVAAVFVILLAIVPAIAPLTEDLGAKPPASLAVMILLSDFLRANLLLLGLLAAGGLAALLAAARAGLLTGPIERLLLDGPIRRTATGLIFGGFAVALGTMISAGAPISEAIRLAIRTVPLAGARRRLEPVALSVRQGEFLSVALGEVRNFPSAIVRLVAVGEASNAVGQMLTRSGGMEEAAALRRIEAAGKLAGPALIILLGAMLGVLMGGLLSGVSQMGAVALD